MTSFLLRLVLVFAYITLCSSSSHKSKLENKNTKFDIYIFTLHWPYTTCMDWTSSGRGHHCAHIDLAEWSVHGVWPTRFGEINPNFCNNSWHYKHDQMEPIMEEMSRYWPDVEMRHVEDSLWSHEWTKHGTCAVLSASETNIHNQTEYFRTGCQLAASNPLTGWLATAGVTPDDSALYEMKEVWQAVIAGTGGFRPHIDCTEVKGEALISEIKLCYNKDLTRVHCDGIVGVRGGSSSEMAGKCLRYSNFLYPASVTLSSDQLGAVPFLYSDSLSLLADLGSGSGQVAGVVCTLLALAVIGLIIGYWCYKRSNRGRGYESL